MPVSVVVRRALVGAALAGVSCGVAFAPAAPAAGRPRIVPGMRAVVRIPAQPMTDRWTGEGTPRAVLRLRDLRPGTLRQLETVVTAGAPNQRVEALGQKITCGEPGRATSRQVWSGTNLVAGRPDVTLRLRLVTAVPASGALDCVARVYVSSHVGQSGARATLRGGWLGDAGPRGPGAEVRMLTGSSNPLVRTAPVVVGRLGPYSPPAGTRRLTVLGDVYTTECHADDNFCPAGKYSPGGFAAPVTWLRARPSSSGCRPATSLQVRARVDGLTHHRRLANTLTLTLPQAGCGTWTLEVLAAGGAAPNPYVVSRVGPYSLLPVLPG